MNDSFVLFDFFYFLLIDDLGGLAPRPAGVPHQPLAPAPKKAPTKKATQAKKTGVKGQKKRQEESDSGSSDESDLEVEPEPSPLPAVRSSEPLEAAHYDTIQAVWSPRNLRVPAEKVKASLVAFKDVVKGLRDGWKDQVQAMKTAENQGDNDKATKIKNAVALQRRIMEKIISTTLETGHPVIVEKYDPLPVSFCFSRSTLSPCGWHGHSLPKTNQEQHPRNFVLCRPGLNSLLITIDLG